MTIALPYSFWYKAPAVIPQLTSVVTGSIESTNTSVPGTVLLIINSPLGANSVDTDILKYCGN